MKVAYHLTVLSDKELHNLLMKRGIPKPEADALKKAVKAEKAAIRSERARKRMVNELWGNVLRPLANEQRIIRSLLRYESQKYPNPQRREALNAYAKVLSTVKEKLREYRHYKERTPKQQAEHLKEQGKTIPNNGEHWTDWVPQKIKDRLTEAFEALRETAAPHARIKEPFRRVMSKSDNNKRRYVLIPTAKRELLEAEQEVTMIRELNKGQPSEAERDAQATVAKIQNILNWLICASDDEVIPATWGEMYAADIPIVELADAEPPAPWD